MGLKKESASAKQNAVDTYIRGFLPATQKALQEIRAIVRRNAPEAKESISYGMPAYTLNGPLVYFAAFKTHIGFYATPKGHAEFAAALARYKSGKGSVQFPLAEKLPAALIARMVRFRVKENLLKAKGKASKKVASTGKAPTGKFAHLKRARHKMPEDIRKALVEQDLFSAYQSRPAYQQNDYLGWISRAARSETRTKRITQMLAELRRGDVYMKMKWGGLGAR